MGCLSTLSSGCLNLHVRALKLQNDVETSPTLKINEINSAFQSYTLKTGTLESYYPFFHTETLVYRYILKFTYLGQKQI